MWRKEGQDLGAWFLRGLVLRSCVELIELANDVQ